MVFSFCLSCCVEVFSLLWSHCLLLLLLLVLLDLRTKKTIAKTHVKQLFPYVFLTNFYDFGLKFKSLIQFEFDSVNDVR